MGGPVTAWSCRKPLALSAFPLSGVRATRRAVAFPSLQDRAPSLVPRNDGVQGPCAVGVQASRDQRCPTADPSLSLSRFSVRHVGPVMARSDAALQCDISSAKHCCSTAARLDVEQSLTALLRYVRRRSSPQSRSHRRSRCRDSEPYSRFWYGPARAAQHANYPCGGRLSVITVFETEMRFA